MGGPPVAPSARGRRAGSAGAHVWPLLWGAAAGRGGRATMGAAAASNLRRTRRPPFPLAVAFPARLRLSALAWPRAAGVGEPTGGDGTGPSPVADALVDRLRRGRAVSAARRQGRAARPWCARFPAGHRAAPEGGRACRGGGGGAAADGAGVTTTGRGGGVTCHADAAVQRTGGVARRHRRRLPPSAGDAAGRCRWGYRPGRHGEAPAPAQATG